MVPISGGDVVFDGEATGPPSGQLARDAPGLSNVSAKFWNFPFTVASPKQPTNNLTEAAVERFIS